MPLTEGQRFDTVVVGGGPAGAATAVGLAREGQRVALVERPRREAVRIGETLPPGVRPVLERLGVWNRFREGGHVASPGIVVVWGRDEPFTTEFICDPHGLGWHIDRPRFDAMLLVAAQDAGAQVHRDTTITGCVGRPGGDWQLDATVGDRRVRARARFLVDATGRAPTLMRRLVSTRRVHDRLVGVVGFVKPDPGSQAGDQRTLIEAVEHGWWYSAALPDGRMVAAFMTDAREAARSGGRLAGLWTRQLGCARHTRERLGERVLDGDVTLAPATSYRRTPVCGSGWLAVGDAAAAYDPLSGQGVCRALETAMAAAEAIADGSDDAFSRYADGIARSFEEYLHLRGHHYSQEDRWPHSRFWRGRHRGHEEVR